MPYAPHRPQESPTPVGTLVAARAAPDETRAKLEATVARLEAELVAAQRLAVLGTMSAMIAHEINNIMTPLLGRAEFALRTGQPADMQKALERARTQAQRAMAVTQRLLALARPEPRPCEPCQVASAVREALETATRPLEKDGIELRVSVPDELRVRAQSDLLVQVLLNLVLNARQAMQGARGVLSISALRDADEVIIAVRDTGSGMPAEHLANVVNPFLAAPEMQTPGAWQAVGLGLNVCRIIAHQHGATIEALPNDDRGCTFRLRWPAA